MSNLKSVLFFTLIIAISSKAFTQKKQNPLSTPSKVPTSNINQTSAQIVDGIGKKVLILSNEFRKKNGLPPLIWDDKIWKISYEHSSNMGKKIVAFGHDGFIGRLKKLPYSYRLAYENVFMCSRMQENVVANTAMNTWTNSSGHKSNLLSLSTHSAVAAFRNSKGEYYLTQIFIKKIDS
jgi:uncharacterized protein YkwD